MKLSVAAFAALSLSITFAEGICAQTPPPGQPYIQVPMPWAPGVGPQRREQWDYDWERWEHCAHLRHQEHEIRERLAYAPYGEERGRLEYRLREVH